MSPITTRLEQSRGLEKGKDQTIIERKKSFRSDGPVVNSSLTAGTTTTLRKGAEHGILSTSKSTILVASKKSEKVIALGTNYFGCICNTCFCFICLAFQRHYIMNS